MAGTVRPTTDTPAGTPHGAGRAREDRLCPGVTIGDDAVIGAGSVVTRDVPAGVVAVGNPARVVRRDIGG
jgi:hypothetical protein